MSNVVTLPLKWTLRSWLEYRRREAKTPEERRVFESALGHLAKGNPARAAAAVPTKHRGMADVLLRVALEERQEEDPAVVTRASVLLDVLDDMSAAYQELPGGSAKAHLHRAAHLLLDLVGPSAGVPRPHARVRPGFEPRGKTT